MESGDDTDLSCGSDSVSVRNYYHHLPPEWRNGKAKVFPPGGGESEALQGAATLQDKKISRKKMLQQFLIVQSAENDRSQQEKSREGFKTK